MEGKEKVVRKSQSVSDALRATSSDASSSALADLLRRVESADGPDRELDADIWLRLTPGATRRKSVIKSREGLWPDYAIDETREADGLLIAVPTYTASLDAALALVERVLPGLYLWRLEFDDEPTPYAYEARVYCRGGEGHSSSKTPALALIAAMLRALPTPSAGDE